MCTIRPLIQYDTPALLEFYRSLSEETTALFRPFAVVNEEVIRAHLAAAEFREHISLGLERADGVILGHGFIVSIQDPQPIFGIGLRDAIQGRGWGRALMQAVMEAADAVPVPLLTLTVVKRNQRARTLYESLGFVLKGEETFLEPMDSYYMERVCPRRKAE